MTALINNDTATGSRESSDPIIGSGDSAESLPGIMTHSGQKLKANRKLISIYPEHFILIASITVICFFLNCLCSLWCTCLYGNDFRTQDTDNK